MNKSKVLKTTLKAVAFTGVFSLLASAQAAFVSLPYPTAEIGVGLPGSAPTGGGTVLADFTAPFADGFVAGTLRSIVVQTGSGTLDFYYKVTNTAPLDPLGDEQIYRVNVLGGFGPTTSTSGGQTGDDPSTLAIEVGGKQASFADRGNGASGDLGFSFPTGPASGALPGADPLNVASGESSSFLVVRTDATSYTSTVAQVSGFGTGVVGTFAAVPEPSSILFGLGMFGVALTNRSKRGASK